MRCPIKKITTGRRKARHHQIHEILNFIIELKLALVLVAEHAKINPIITDVKIDPITPTIENPKGETVEIFSMGKSTSPVIWIDRHIIKTIIKTDMK